MLRVILVALDGSPYSSCAVELGIRLAHQFNASLLGLGVIDEPTICRAEMVPIGGSYYKQRRDEAVLARACRQVKCFLEHFTSRCTEAGVASQVLGDVGKPCEQIAIESQRCDLILLGQRTYFHFATQEGPCETVRKLLKSTPRPVVTAPEKLEDGTSVVIAYDGSVEAARALQAFQLSGLARNKEVNIVTVGDSHVEAASHADRAMEFLAFHEIKAREHVLVSAPVDKAILNQARQLNAELIVMGAFGKPTLREFFPGRVTRSILKNSTIPLFLYH
jgi:nucleotide-binding universal stress UspA family protein